jgi:hypothetical protein
MPQILTALAMPMYFTVLLTVEVEEVLLVV